MFFEYKNNKLFWQNTDLEAVCFELENILEKDYRYSGAYYLYNAEILKDRLELMSRSLPNSRFYYSVKSLSNIHILKKIREHAKFGLDVVSEGEILRGIIANFKGKEMVFAGVGKKRTEIIFALEKNIKSFHVESVDELKNIAEIALSLGKKAPVGLRINPNIEADTHEYIKTGLDENKFGLSSEEFTQALEIIGESSALNLVGLQIHIGSQIKDSEPYIKALSVLTTLAKTVNERFSKPLEYLSLGGGFGIDYENDPEENKLNDFPLLEIANHEIYKSSEYKIDFEPGRFISGYTGVLITNVLYNKNKKNFSIAITDAGMNDLLRPALYQAKHPVLPLIKRSEKKSVYDIAGPICESSDYLAKKRELTEIQKKDRLAVLYSGAYGSVMSSNYNSRPLVPEFLIDNNKAILIRKPQTLSQMIELETSVL